MLPTAAIILCIYISGKLSHTNIHVLTRNYYRKEMLPERDRFDLHLAIQLAFGSSVGIIEKILACVQPELQASYTCNTYNNVLWV